MKDLEEKLITLELCYWKTVDNARTPEQREHDYLRPKQDYCKKCTGYRIKSCHLYYAGELNT